MLDFWRSHGPPWPPGAFYTAFAGLLLLLVGLHEIPMLVAVARDCYHYYDLGIYAQALAKLSVHDWNPWLPGRQVHIFNDHFDPVLLLAKPLTWLVRPPLAAACAEASITLLVAWPFLWLRRRGDLTDGATLLLCGLAWFNPGMLLAIHYPVHPGTWSVLPLTWMVVGWQLRRDGIMLLGLLAACACKEEMPFVGLALAGLLFYEGRRRAAATALTLSGTWLAMVFIGRPLLLGPSVPYAKTFADGLFSQPWQALTTRLHSHKLWHRLGEALLVALPAVVAWPRRYTWRACALVLPLLAVRFLGQRWAFHYMAPVSALIAASAIGVWRRQPVPRWVGALAALLFYLWQTVYVREAWTLATGHEAGSRWARCGQGAERQQALRQAEDWVLQQDGRLLASSNVVLDRLLLRPATFVIHQAVDSAAPFDLIFYDKPTLGGGFYPDIRNLERSEAQVAAWREAASLVLIDSDLFFVARGRFGHPVRPAD